MQALIREIEEELDLHINLEKITYLCQVIAPAYGEKNNIIMEQECFFYPLQEEIKPQNEILEVKYFSWEEYLQEPEQVPGVLIVFDELKKQNKIK